MYCKNCGKKIDDKAEVCVGCGVKCKQEEKNPTIAAILSFLFVGLGQIYNGEVAKGIGFMVIAVLLFLTIFVVIGVVLYPAFYIYQIYEAYKTAKTN